MTPAARINLAALALAALTVAVLSLCFGGSPEVAAGSPGDDRIQPAAPTISAPVPAARTAQAAVSVEHRVFSRPTMRRSPHPPGTRIPIDSLPEVDSGIPLPDGSFLPLLNGMTYAPMLQRDARYGPLPRVVAINVDGDGYEWYEHADGSTTSSKYQEVLIRGGEVRYWDPATYHGVPDHNETGMPAQGGPIPRGGVK